MKSIYEVRRENLVNLINKEFNGVQTRMAERIGTQANLVNRWALGKKIIGDQSARKIEAAARKPNYWLDIDYEAREASYQYVENEDISQVLSRNLSSWMHENADLSSQGKLGKACGLAQSTIGRIINCDASVSISTLEQIAQAFGRHGYELLIHPGDPSVIKYNRQKYAQLPQEDKTRVENFISFAISQHENQIK